MQACQTHSQWPTCQIRHGVHPAVSLTVLEGLNKGENRPALVHPQWVEENLYSLARQFLLSGSTNFTHYVRNPVADHK